MKLKPGPGRSPQEVDADQRARLCTAMVELVAEGGYRSVTVRELARTAGVSTRTLYRHYGSVLDCFAATYQSRTRKALERAAATLRLDAALTGGLNLRPLVHALAQRPKEARLVLIEAYGGGPGLRELIRAAQDEFAQLLVETLEALPGWGEVPLYVARGLVAGLAHLARTRLLPERGVEPPADPRELDSLADEATAWLLSMREVCAVASRPVRVPPGSAGGRVGAAPRVPASDERGRILAAALGLATRDGYESLTVSRLRQSAGVSRRAFDTRFADVDDCFLAAIEDLALTTLGRVERLAAGRGGESAVRSASLALCTEAARELALSQLVFVDVLAPGPAGLRCRESVIAAAAGRLRRSVPPDRRLSQLAAEASLAAAWELLQTEITVGRQARLPALALTLSCMLTATAPAAPVAI